MDSLDRYNRTSVAAKQDADLRGRLEFRSRALKATRECFLQRDYVEIDTPIMRICEDATDNPVFSTLGPLGWPRLHLRTSPEEYTRRSAAVFGKAFEIGKSFRNVWIDPDADPRLHLVEFTHVEFYEQGNNLEQALDLLWGIINEIAEKLSISEISFKGHTVDLTGSYDRLKIYEALERAAQAGHIKCDAFVREHRQSLVQFNRDKEACRLENLLNSYVRPTLIEPCYLSDFPFSADPLADKTVDNCLQRAELTIAGIEVGEVGVLQTDVDVLREHLQRAINDRHGEKASSQLVDQAYLDEINELDCNVIGGGFGFDRLLMLLTGVSDIREVVWYPGVNEHFVRRRMS